MGKPFPACTDEELRAKAKTFTTLIVVLYLVFALMVATIIYFAVSGKDVNFATLVAPMTGLIGGSMPAIIGLSKVKQELKSRERDSGS